MSTQVVVDKHDEAHKIIPESGKYGPSIFANVVSILSVILLLVIGAILLFAVATSYITINEFVQVAQQGFPDNPYVSNPDGTPKVNADGSIQYLRWNYWMRWSFGGYLLALTFYFPTKWLMRTYGRQSFQISDEGVTVKKFPRFKYFVPWDGILDITVKESESIFSIFNRNVSKITVYTMDRSINIESLTLRRQKQLSEQLFKFGESLEERVIDFGYGAQLAVVWRRIKRSKVGVLGLVLVLFWILVSLVSISILIVDPVNTVNSQLKQRVLGGLWNPNFLNTKALNAPPSLEHPFGTDSLGRDLFARVFFGSFYSILIGVIATFISVSIGAFVGAASGYLGGTIDQLIQRITEVLNAIPGLPLLLLVSAAFGPLFQAIDIEGAYYLVVFSIFSLFSWGGNARIVRSEVLAIKQSEFIQAERVLGATHWRIITKHIMPNALSTVIIFFTLGIAGAIISVASIAFLGFGTETTLVWGSDLSAAIFNQPLTRWWGVTFISVCLFTLVLGFNLLGDALRDALDPRLKE